MIEIPDLTAVRSIVGVLEQRGLIAAIGGSGLLLALGLTETMHEWDITTDGSASQAVAALEAAGIDHRLVPPAGGHFATHARYIVDGTEHDVAVIVGFAVRVDGEVVELPPRVSGTWQDLPLADPRVWEQVYRLIGRSEKADLLARWLERADASPPPVS